MTEGKRTHASNQIVWVDATSKPAAADSGDGVPHIPTHLMQQMLGWVLLTYIPNAV